MAIISKERTFTLEKLKRIKSLDIAYIFLVLTLILPFFLFKRAAPQAAFYSELTGVICVALFLIFACFGIKHFLIFNRLTLYLTAIASYLIFDIFINQPIYPSLQWLYIGSLLLSGLVSIIISSLCHQQGYKKILVTVCYGLMIGAISQDIVVILQTLHQDWTGGWINYIGLGQPYSGNIGQRNLLAHYLSWGILATAYLVYQKRLARVTGLTVVIFQAAILGAVNSVTLILYMLSILLLLVIARYWQKRLPKSIIKTLALTVIAVLIFQAITLPVITSISIQDTFTTNTSSIGRLSGSSDYKSRLTEWHKAWLIFLENPWFGTGWNSYGYQGFMISSDPRFASDMSGNGLFTHTHSIFFNLLAETGIFGTIIILGGFFYLLKPILTSQWRVETVVILAMMIVTGVHSLLEFPLWNTHFFLVFIILLTILIRSNTASQTSTKGQPSNNSDTKILVVIFSLLCLFLAMQMYVLYWKMEQYSFSQDNNDQERIATSEKILELGNQQPLLRAYSDFKAIIYLTGISADKIPSKFDQPLYNSTHYFPDKMSGINYLIKQCEANGAWSTSNWLYYDQLSHYYKNNLQSYSILLSMTINCDQVYDTIYKACKNYYREKGQNPVCSLEESKANFDKR